jgi:hypothetical protein
MQTKAKANSTITHSMQDGKIEFRVLNAGSFTFDPDKVSAENRARAMIHGFVQRISDGGALSRNPDTGLPATPADKMARMQRIADHLMSGATEWALRVAASQPDSGLTLMGIMRALGIDLETAEARLAKMAAKLGVDRAACIKRLGEAPDVIKAIGEIKAERAAAGTKVNASDLLAEMDDEDEEDDEEDAEEEGDEESDDEADEDTPE